MFSNSSNGGQGNQSHVYQIDFTAVASGKRIASSKRRVRWRFGFANLDALAAGQTGTDCRGEEHDVTIVWSVTSGKRLVLADGKEVHNTKNRNNVFEFSWTMRGNHVLKVVAHAQPPMTAMPGFRQYDFFVDGQSFFTFPKVFRLGLAPNDPRGGGRRRQQQHQQQQQQHDDSTHVYLPPSRSGYNTNNGGYHHYNGGGGGSVGANTGALAPYVHAGDATSVRSLRSANSNNIVSIEAPHNPEEEDAYLRQAIENSLKENPSAAAQNRHPPASAPSAGGNLLLDFMSPAGTTPVPALPPSTSQYNDPFGAPPTQPAAFAALPPSTTAQQQMVPTGAPADPWAMATMSAALPPSAGGPPVATTANPFAAPAVGGAPPTLASNQDPFGASIGAPATQAGVASTPYGVAPAAPFGSPPPSTINGPPKEEFTPATQASSIGFASPMAQPFRPQEDQQHQHQQPLATEAPAPEPPQDVPAELAPAPPSNPALLSMNVLSGQPQPLVTESMANGANGTAGGSMADQAYAKLVNMDAFDLVQSKDSESRQNPFDVAVAPIGGRAPSANASASLADMKAAKKLSEPKKSIMNAAPAPAAGAMVLAGNQQGNFGGYGGLSMGQPPQQQQQPPMMGQPPPLQGYGGMPQQPPAYGMQAQAPQAYGQQPAYGMQAPAPSYGMQGQFGQPPPLQQQPPPQAYGQQQPPPLQQQPFGF